MNKRYRQYAGLLSAVAAYYLIHEGAHLIAALCMGVFKEIRFMGLGVQIDVYAARMTDVQKGIFCLVGAVAALAAGYVLACLADKIGKSRSKVFKACMYYFLCFFIVSALSFTLTSLVFAVVGTSFETVIFSLVFVFIPDR